MSRICVAFAMACLLAACASPDAPRSDSTSAAPLVPTTRVIDGITVLEHPASAFANAARFTIDTVPVAVMGGVAVDPKYDLTHADIVVPLRNGRYATFGRVGSQLMVFDAKGKGEHLWGGQGEGPGYFVRVNAMLSLGGDTLFLIDDANRRRNWVLPDRGVVRQEPYEPTLRMHGLMPTGFLEDGSLVAFDAAGRSETVDSTTRWAVPLVLMAHKGDSARVVDSIPGWEVTPFETHFRGRKAISPTLVRLGRSPKIAAWDSTITSTANDSYAIDLRRPSGHLFERITVTVPRREVTQSMRDSLIAAGLRRFSASGEGEGMVDPAESKRLISAEPIADSLPFIQGLFVTDDKTLWVVDAIAPGDPGWDATAFHTDGAIIGRLHVRGSSVPIAFTNDRVIVRTEDEDGVISFLVYRIVPTPR